MARKETWTPTSLQQVGKFVEALEELLQEWGESDGFRVKDILLTLEDYEQPRGVDRTSWGLVSMLDREDTTLQFEPGGPEVELGLV